MKKYSALAFFAPTLLSAALMAVMPLSIAQTAATAAKTTTTTTTTATTTKAAAKPAAAKKPVKKAAKKKTGDRAVPVSQASSGPKMPLSSDAEDDENEPDVGTTKSADFNCEMGVKLTIYKNDDDDKHIAIKEGKRLSRLTRVSTTTGANRFENRKLGLVWIGIPAKGILLDSKNGHQLANDCKNADLAASNQTGVLAAPPQK